MTKVQKITFSPSRDIPFNKLVVGESNVRRVKAGVSIEQLAESIAQRTLLQSLNVRAVINNEDSETGMFEVPAGGRRYRALELLVKQKRMAKSQLVACFVRDGGIAEDDSLAENDERWGCIRSISSEPSRLCALVGEIISWKLRMFVPSDASGIEVLAKVLDHYAVERIAEREAA